MESPVGQQVARSALQYFRSFVNLLRWSAALLGSLLVVVSQVLTGFTMDPAPAPEAQAVLSAGAAATASPPARDWTARYLRALTDQWGSFFLLGLILGGPGWAMVVAHAVAGRRKPQSLNEDVDSNVSLEEEADRWLRRIRYQQSYTSGWSGSLNFPMGLGGTGINSSVTTQERPLSLPDIVNGYSAFVRRITGVEQTQSTGEPGNEETAEPVSAEEDLGDQGQSKGVQGTGGEDKDTQGHEQQTDEDQAPKEGLDQSETGRDRLSKIKVLRDAIKRFWTAEGQAEGVNDAEGKTEPVQGDETKGLEDQGNGGQSLEGSGTEGQPQPDAVSADETRQQAGTRQLSTDEKFRLIIVIDEMDKMENDGQAQDFLNQIKVIFGKEQCFYMVSVSEGAMSDFERRDLPFHNVFDSSFDKIVYVNYLTLPKAWQLLVSRVLGTSASFAAVCCCLSGGLPLDLIRACRDLYDELIRNPK